jgi:hypothetical protein
MPPLAITGIEIVSLIFLIIFQSHGPVKSFFYSLVLPCTVNKLHPCFYNPNAKFNVFYSLSKTLILQVIGTFKLVFIAQTNLNINSGSFKR